MGRILSNLLFVWGPEETTVSYPVDSFLIALLRLHSMQRGKNRFPLVLITATCVLGLRSATVMIHAFLNFKNCHTLRMRYYSHFV